MTDTNMWVCLTFIGVIFAGFCIIQIRGCQQENNERIAGLAKQGIKAELAANGELRIIDTRDAVREAAK